MEQGLGDCHNNIAMAAFACTKCQGWWTLVTYHKCTTCWSGTACRSSLIHQHWKGEWSVKIFCISYCLTLCIWRHLAHFIWSRFLHLFFPLFLITETEKRIMRMDGSLFFCLSFSLLILCHVSLHHSRLQYTFSQRRLKGKVAPSAQKDAWEASILK